MHTKCVAKFCSQRVSLRLMLPHGELLSMWCASGKPTTASGMDILLKRHAWDPSLDMIFKATPKNIIGKIFFIFFYINRMEREICLCDLNLYVPVNIFQLKQG